MRTTITLIVLTMCVDQSMAQNFGELNVNDIRMRMRSDGSIGTSGISSPVTWFEVPQGNGTTTLYASGFWFSGISPSDDTLVAAHTYSIPQIGMDFFPGPLTADGTASISPTVSDLYDHVWVVERSDILNHLAYFNCVDDPGCDPASLFPGGYVIPTSILEWPALNATPGYDPDLAPFFDHDGDGIYDPTVGDAPCILGDQAMFLVYNDMLQPHAYTDGEGVGLEVQVMPFTYSGHSQALDQTVFLRYRVINRSATTYNDSFVGLFHDFDIGCSNDDFIGTDPSRNLFYAYNWSDFDESCLGALGYGASPPAFGMTILKGPLVDADGTDTPTGNLLPAWNGIGFGDGSVDNERHGLARSIYYNREGSQHTTDPTTITHFRGYLDARWKNGLPLTYGGTGYSTDPGAIPCFYMFPGANDPVGAGTNGVPQPSWSELVPTPAIPDRRGVMSTGPFTFEPGEHLDLLFAYVYARSNDGALASVAALQARTDSVIAFASTLPIWDMADDASWSLQCEDYLNVAIAEQQQRTPLALYPSPTNDAFHFDAPLALAGAVLVVRDVTGREVLRQGLVAGLNRVALHGASPGVYLCEVATDKGRYTGRVVKE